jgi:hypothetical protein
LREVRTRRHNNVARRLHSVEKVVRVQRENINCEQPARREQKHELNFLERETETRDLRHF